MRALIYAAKLHSLLLSFLLLSLFLSDLFMFVCVCACLYMWVCTRLHICIHYLCTCTSKCMYSREPWWHPNSCVYQHAHPIRVYTSMHTQFECLLITLMLHALSTYAHAHSTRTDIKTLFPGKICEMLQFGKSIHAPVAQIHAPRCRSERRKLKSSRRRRKRRSAQSDDSESSDEDL